MSLRDKISAADDRRFQDEYVSEWSVEVRVRGLTGSDRDAYESKILALRSGGREVEVKLKDFRSQFLVKCLHDPETDERIYGDSQADIDELGSKSAEVIDRLHEIALRVSGMDASAVEESQANFGSDPSDGSIIG